VSDLLLAVHVIIARRIVAFSHCIRCCCHAVYFRFLYLVFISLLPYRSEILLKALIIKLNICCCDCILHAMKSINKQLIKYVRFSYLDCEIGLSGLFSL